MGMLNPTPVVEVFEPIQLPGDELAPVDAVVKRRRVVSLLSPLAPIVAGEVQRVRLGQVCRERGGEVCVSSRSLVACRFYLLLVVSSRLGGNGWRRSGWGDLEGNLGKHVWSLVQQRVVRSLWSAPGWLQARRRSGDWPGLDGKLFGQRLRWPHNTFRLQQLNRQACVLWPRRYWADYGQERLVLTCRLLGFLRFNGFSQDRNVWLDWTAGSLHLLQPGCNTVHLGVWHVQAALGHVHARLAWAQVQRLPSRAAPLHLLTKTAFHAALYDLLDRQGCVRRWAGCHFIDGLQDRFSLFHIRVRL